MYQIYHFSVYTLNTRSTGISLFLTAKNVIFSFHAVVWPAKRQLYVCSKFGTTKYVSRAFSYWFLAWKYVISDKVYNLTCTWCQYDLPCCIVTSKNIIPFFAFSLMRSVDLFYYLFGGFQP